MRLVVALGGSLLWDKAGISGDRGVQEGRGMRGPQYSPLLHLPASGTAGRVGGSHRGDKGTVSRGHQYPEPPKTGTVRGPLTAPPQVLCGLLGALLREEECRKAERSLNPLKEGTRKTRTVSVSEEVSGRHWALLPTTSEALRGCTGHCCPQVLGG